MQALKYVAPDVHAELVVSHYHKTAIKILREAHCIIANIDKDNLLHIRYTGDNDTAINYGFLYQQLHDFRNNNPTLKYGCITLDDMFIINHGVSFATYRYISIPFITLIRLLVLVGAIRPDHGEINCMGREYKVDAQGVHHVIDQEWYHELSNAVREEKDYNQIASMALTPLRSALSTLHDGQRALAILKALAAEVRESMDDGLRSYSEDGIRNRLLSKATRLYTGYTPDADSV